MVVMTLMEITMNKIATATQDKQHSIQQDCTAGDGEMGQ
jgi:hypothetical protein